jgi:hypothetical protein
MLKAEYGMTHGAAHRVSLLARQTTDPAPDVDPAGTLYAGRKAGLRPIHDALMRAVTALGDDLNIAPKKGYLSLRRRKQFAMIQPSTATRVDLGLILNDVPVNERLETAVGFNALFTHRIRLTTPADVDADLATWLRRAYEQAGRPPEWPAHLRVNRQRTLLPLFRHGNTARRGRRLRPPIRPAVPARCRSRSRPPGPAADRLRPRHAAGLAHRSANIDWHEPKRRLRVIPTKHLDCI